MERNGGWEFEKGERGGAGIPPCQIILIRTGSINLYTHSPLFYLPSFRQLMLYSTNMTMTMTMTMIAVVIVIMTYSLPYQST